MPRDNPGDFTPTDAVLITVLRRHLATVALSRLERRWLCEILAYWNNVGHLTPDTRAMITMIAECHAEEVTL